MSAPILALFLVVTGAVAGIFYGIAAVVRAVYDGKAKLVRARRGDPEFAAERPALSGFLRVNPRSGE
jgi:hypothetical protein